MTLQGVDEFFQAGYQPFSADAIGDAPDGDEGVFHLKAVAPIAMAFFAPPSFGRMIQQLNRILAVIARGSYKFVQDLPLVIPTGCPIAGCNRG